MNKRKLIKNILGWLVAAAIIFILIRTIYNHRAELENWDWRINWLYAFLSMATLLGAYICGSMIWRAVLKGFGINVALHESFRVIYLANLGRYIPGKVFQVVGMVGLAKQLDIPAKVSLASFALIQAYALPASFVLIGFFFLFGHPPHSLVIFRDVMYLFMGAVLLFFLFLFFKPDGLNWALNRVLRLFKAEPVNYNPAMQNRIIIFIWCLLNWGLFGVSFYFFTKALMSLANGLGFVYLAGSYVTAYIVGYVTFLSPAGLGVREGVMSALLTPTFGAPVAASIALIHRLLITIAEAAITLLALATYKIRRRDNNATHSE
jgi:glycosyltransferase 2 family protein